MSFPAGPPAVALMGGVVLGWLASGSVVAEVVAMVAVVLTWCLSALALRCGAERLLVAGAILGFTAVGGLLGSVSTRTAERPTLVAWHDASQASGGLSSPVLLEGTLTQDATQSTYGARLELSVERVKAPTGWTSVAGGIRILVAGQFVAERLHKWSAGRKLRLPVTLRTPARHLNPGVSDRARQLRLRGTSLLGSTKSALLVETTEVAGWTAETAHWVRAAVRRRVARTVGRYGDRSAGLVTAVLIGDRSSLPDEDRRRLQEGGTYHVVAISGGNVAILSTLLLGIGTAVLGTGRAPVVLTIVSLAAYASVVGSESSVARATVAAIVFLAAKVADHRTSPLNTLAWTAVCLVSVVPLAMFDPGFWLTFGATLGILVGVPPLVEFIETRCWMHPWLSPVGRPAIVLFAASLCAETVLLPVSTMLFSRVTVAGLLLNFAAVPLMTVTQLAGMVAVGLGDVSPALGAAAGYVAHLAALGIVESARLVDVWPALSWRVPSPTLGVSCLYYAGWLVCLRRASTSRHKVAGATLVVASGLLITTGWVPTLPSLAVERGMGALLVGARTRCQDLHRPTRAVFLDVDQADATLIQTASGRSLLVDAGGTVGPGATSTVGERVVAPVLWAAGVRRLDYLVLTHGHPDHIGGAPAVVSDFVPHEVWEGIPVVSSKRLQGIREDAARVGAIWRQVQSGDVVRVDDVEVRIVHPGRPDWERPAIRNDDSIVLEIRHGDVSIVLPGDIGEDVEQALLGEFGPARVRVVKVPHHGSRTSSSPAFVAALRANVAVVSAGRANAFGHPAPEVVGRYVDAGARVYHTGFDGAITLCTDGSVVQIETADGGGPLTLGAPVALGAAATSRALAVPVSVEYGQEVQ